MRPPLTSSCQGVRRYKLLLSLDSYWLCSHLIPLWMARLHHAALGTEYSPSKPPARGTEGAEGAEGPWEEWEADPVAEEQSVLRCCVLARFVGLLLASPNSHAELHSSHPFRAALREVSPHRCRAHSLLFAGFMHALRRMHAWIEVNFCFPLSFFSHIVPRSPATHACCAFMRGAAMSHLQKTKSQPPISLQRMHACMHSRTERFRCNTHPLEAYATPMKACRSVDERLHSPLEPAGGRRPAAAVSPPGEPAAVHCAVRTPPGQASPYSNHRPLDGLVTTHAKPLNLYSLQPYIEMRDMSL